jgi:hypothetical protein
VLADSGVCLQHRLCRDSDHHKVLARFSYLQSEGKRRRWTFIVDKSSPVVINRSEDDIGRGELKNIPRLLALPINIEDHEQI